MRPGGHRSRASGAHLRYRVRSASARRSNGRAAGATSPGQSLAEFALVVPFLLILLVTVADFGRYFAAGVRVESIARTAAETAAQEYLRAASPDYVALHADAWQTVCNEADGLAGITYNGPASQCDGIPTMVCVHDGTDGLCPDTYNASGGAPAQCSALHAPISNAQTGGAEASRYVEVRVCYRFSTIFGFAVPFLGGTLIPPSGDFWIQKSRTFTVADY